MINLGTSGRMAVAGGVLGVTAIAGALGAAAVVDSGSTTPVETSTTAPTVSAPAPTTVPVSASAAPVTAASGAGTGAAVAASGGTVSPGSAGVRLPAPPPAPTAENPAVQSVPGPVGPVYPDGYVDPTVTTAPAPPPPPNMTPGSADWCRYHALDHDLSLYHQYCG